MAQGNRNDSTWFSLKSTLGGPITVIVISLGVLLILLGVFLQTGVWAGLFGILGAMFIITATVARLLIELSRKM